MGSDWCIPFLSSSCCHGLIEPNSVWFTPSRCEADIEIISFFVGSTVCSCSSVKLDRKWDQHVIQLFNSVHPSLSSFYFKSSILTGWPQVHWPYACKSNYSFGKSTLFTAKALVLAYTNSVWQWPVPNLVSSPFLRLKPIFLPPNLWPFPGLGLL